MIEHRRFVCSVTGTPTLNVVEEEQANGPKTKGKQRHQCVKHRVAKNCTLGGYGWVVGHFAEILAASTHQTGEKVTDECQIMLANPPGCM